MTDRGSPALQVTLPIPPVVQVTPEPPSDAGALVVPGTGP